MSLGCAAASAHADLIDDYVAHPFGIHVQAGIGLSKADTPDGRWQQAGIPGGSHVTAKPPTFSLGLTGPLLTRGAWGVDWHLDYVNLGRFAASCSCTPMDENYDPKTHAYTPKVAVPTAFFTGEGRSQGAALTAEVYYWLYSVRLAAEAGAYIHRDSWSEDVSNWQVGGYPQNLHLSDTYWSVAPVVGVSVGYGRMSVSARHYFTKLNSQNRSVPPLWNDVTTVEMKVKF
ncbi:hypothetical protein [Paraburkholderia kirstenboschensis]|uniref:Uncharacterized protein n=1 Tax=Paraburkholderia kirstenboschensis TaxID=1245436 RepID=A0ABZ0ENB3_9BURK|nr:hypothetical protein [Paraburkholderia kirstenboschensis]WOD18656.1 hypothetical protein RW095_38815 [Paraburkholderia kirstenboschensis]